MRVSLPEQVWIDFEPATFGSRTLAFLFDFFLRWSLITVIALLLLLVSSQSWLLFAASHHQFTFPLLVLFTFAVEWAYPIYFEVWRNGVTPGKKAMGLRVVDERGLPISFRASFLRTVLKTVDVLPGMGMVAFFSMTLTAKSQRLGDLVAGTLVVHELGAEEDGFASQGGEAAEHVLPLELYNVIEKYLSRRNQFTSEARQETCLRICQAIRKHCPELEAPSFVSLPKAEQSLVTLFQNSRPAKATAASSKEDRSINWKALDQQLDQTQTLLGGLEEQPERVSARQLFAVASAYQRICQLYAQLSTFYPETREAKEAARLVRRGRILIYGKRLGALREDRLSFFQRIPQSFQVLQNYCLLSLILGAVSAATAAILVQVNPALSWFFLSEEKAAQLSSGHLWTEQIQGISSLASSQIMTNNISVTLTAFALGITGGIGTAAVIISNGAMLGGVFSALSYYQMSHRLGDFVAAHGFLELSVIFVAGGCGLYLGDALLAPGSRSRKQALAEHGRHVVDLLVFNAICLIAAGFVEGFVSPQEFIPFWFKLTLGLVLAIGYWSYLLTGRIFPGSVK